MNKILSLVRRCVEDYDMIQPGDRIAVGVSGGKDSLTLLVALAKLKEFYPVPFSVEAFTLDMGHAEGREGMDFSRVAELCGALGVPYTLLSSEIHHIIFEPLLHVRQNAPGGASQRPSGAWDHQDRSGTSLRRCH